MDLGINEAYIGELSICNAEVSAEKDKSKKYIIWMNGCFQKNIREKDRESGNKYIKDTKMWR